jgi:predicted AlkP superfamily pyrophosphatase or phosphodiesterase
LEIVLYTMRTQLFLLSALAIAACSRVEPVSRAGIVQQGSARAPHGRVSDHLIVVSIDGLRPDAIDRFKVPTLSRLMREGRHASDAQTIELSLTLPSHTSMLTGVDSDQHGVTWNSNETASLGFVKVPTIFGLAREAGFNTAAFFSKTKFEHLEVPSTLDYSQGPTRGPFPWSSARTLGLVERHLRTASPNLLFVHFADVDYAGHSFGWMGFTYGSALRDVDRALARLLTVADSRFGVGQYTLIVTADHGGHGTTHGTTDKADMTIPWIVWGEGVKRGESLAGIHTMDTAATALWVLGVAVPENWTGRAQTSVFEGTPTAR